MELCPTISNDEVRAVFEYRKTKTKIITLANYKEHTHNPAIQWKLEENTWSRHEARENVRERITIGFGFTWWKKWGEFFEPISLSVVM